MLNTYQAFFASVEAGRSSARAFSIKLSFRRVLGATCLSDSNSKPDTPFRQEIRSRTVAAQRSPVAVPPCRTLRNRSLPLQYPGRLFIGISGDEFELVIGVFEKQYAFLLQGLETGVDFPVPNWIPITAALPKIGRAVYPYWKVRRVERGGHCIIPPLNGDESDTLNVSRLQSFNDKADEELLIDKERTTKKPDTSRVRGPKIRTNDPSLPPPRQEVVIRPKERLQRVRDEIEANLQRQTEADHHWENTVDNAYQALPVPYASKFFKYIPPSNASSWPSSNSGPD
ncbi:hypothetical protein GALMADRAFT_144248 [Galerina marginata CBS 339.88]|uniref:Uncharacterized protein n=1 Tax=Galerina marginata (strain CBS 339.88) TaxID=685588 RepID=A0A067SMB9_GALM3|nr:hypothetical protein GALMADRAFT_144248 [Galerina marginata CBS 339.88]